jgi:tellurium resistance protein TerD
MAFNVNKGGSFALNKTTKFTVGLGWDVSGASTDFDLDAHAFGVVAGPKLYNNASHAVTYANTDLVKNGKSFGTTDGSIISLGDNLTGAGDGADESIVIDTDKLPAEITEVLVFLTIHEAAKRGQHFGQVKNAFLSIANDGGTELCRYNLTTEFTGCISIQVGSFEKGKDGTWQFNALGAGLQKEDLGMILDMLS